MKRFLKIFAAVFATLFCLSVISSETMNRVTLPNGLYVYKTPFIPTTFATHHFYIYNV